MLDLINFANYSRETLFIAGIVIGLVIGALVGAVAIALFHGRNARRFYHAGCRDTERLYLGRIAQDRRDDAPLSQPITR